MLDVTKRILFQLHALLSFYILYESGVILECRSPCSVFIVECLELYCRLCCGRMRERNKEKSSVLYWIVIVMCIKYKRLIDHVSFYKQLQQFRNGKLILYYSPLQTLSLHILVTGLLVTHRDQFKIQLILNSESSQNHPQ